MGDLEQGDLKPLGRQAIQKRGDPFAVAADDHQRALAHSGGQGGKLQACAGAEYNSGRCSKFEFHVNTSF